MPPRRILHKHISLKFLRQLRKEGFSNEGIAKILGCSRNTVYNYIGGAKKYSKLYDPCFWCKKNRCKDDHEDDMKRERWRHHIKTYDQLVRDGFLQKRKRKRKANTIVKESWYFTNMRANMKREGKPEEEIERAVNALKAQWSRRNVITDHWGL